MEWQLNQFKPACNRLNGHSNIRFIRYIRWIGYWWLFNVKLANIPCKDREHVNDILYIKLNLKKGGVRQSGYDC